METSLRMEHFPKIVRLKTSIENVHPTLNTFIRTY